MAVCHGPVILPSVSWTVWWVNDILLDNESVWHNLWPQNKCRSQWPFISSSSDLALYYGWSSFFSDNVSVWCNLWPHKECQPAWPKFPLILPYILKSIWWMNVILLDNESVWRNLWPKNKCSSQWPIFHGPMILAYRYIVYGWKSCFGILSQCDLKIDHINLLYILLKIVSWMNVVLWDNDWVGMMY